jgi:hypothetical protein
MVWYMLAANALQQMALLRVFSYLAAHLLHTAQMTVGDTVLPLALAGGGLITGGVLGGCIADHRHRLAWFALACVGGGVLAASVFTVRVPAWVTVAFACGMAGLGCISSVVTPAWLLERASGSRTTATGAFAASNRVGVFGGASLGGLMLALGGFPLVGLFCLGVAVLAAVVIRLKVRDSAASPAQRALCQGSTTTSERKIAGGEARLNIGFARAFQPYELRHFGVSMDKSVARFQEGIECWLAAHRTGKARYRRWVQQWTDRKYHGTRGKAHLVWSVVIRRCETGGSVKETTGTFARTERAMADHLDNGAVGLHWVAADRTILCANRADYVPLGYTREE